MAQGATRGGLEARQKSSCRARKFYPPCQWRVRGGSAYLCEHERAAIQSRDPRPRRSCPWDGHDCVRPPQETERTDSIDVDHDVRWNAGHYEGHGVLRAPRSRGGAAGAGSRAAGTLPPHRARQQRSLRRASATRAVADAVPAVDGSLHSPARRQPQRADQSIESVFPIERRLGAQSHRPRLLHPLQSQPIAAAAAPVARSSSIGRFPPSKQSLVQTSGRA
jgi:hypothetical protein